MDETELQECIQYIRSKYSDRIIDKIFLNADDDSVSIRCELLAPGRNSHLGVRTFYWT